MSMTLRLTDEQDRALTALAEAEGVSKNEAYDLVIGATGGFECHRVAIRLSSWTTGP